MTGTEARAWFNHGLMNLGSILSAIYHAVLPPRWTGHDERTISSLAAMHPLDAFLAGFEAEP